LSSVRCVRGAVIVREVHGQDATQVAFAQNDDMIEAVTPDRTDEAVGGREHFADPHALYSLPKGVAVDVVAIAEEVGWRGVVREGGHELLGGPGRGGMLGHVDVDDAPALGGRARRGQRTPAGSRWGP